MGEDGRGGTTCRRGERLAGIGEEGQEIAKPVERRGGGRVGGAVEVEVGVSCYVLT